MTKWFKNVMSGLKLKAARQIIRNSDRLPDEVVEWAYEVYRTN